MMLDHTKVPGSTIMALGIASATDEFAEREITRQVIDTDPSLGHFSRGRYDLPLAPLWVR
jgi:hypothetical protein